MQRDSNSLLEPGGKQAESRGLAERGAVDLDLETTIAAKGGESYKQ